MTDPGRHQPPPRLTRADLDALPNYVPGRNPADLARELGLPEAIKLASNEVPYGPLPGVVEAVTEAAATSHRYPDMGVVALRDALAERYGVDADRIATGCGSVALAEHLVRATCLPGDEMLYSWRSFEAYPIIAATSGATSVRVPNTAGHGHDLAAMAAAVTDRTRLMLVCNPNNPTGTSGAPGGAGPLPRRRAGRRAGGAGRGVPRVRHRPGGAGRTATYGDRPNVVVLRTLSKAWGLAGLRIGFLVAQPEVAAAVRKVVTPFSTSLVAQAAALAALRQADEVEPALRAGGRRAGPGHRGGAQAACRTCRRARPTSSGCRWATGRSSSAKACEARGVIVRPFAGDGVRVTIGTPAENDAFLAAAEVALG